MELIFSKKQKLVCWFLLIGGLLPYFYISKFAHPIADDFSYTYQLWKRGFWESQILDYQFWNGRYFSNLLVYNNPLAWHSFTIYRLAPIVLLLSTITSIAVFIKTVIPELTIKLTLLISLFLTLLYVHQMPTLVEGYYWFTSAVTYQVANILSLLYFSLLIKITTKNKSIFLQKALASILLVSIVGCNEVSMLILLGFHTIVLYLNFITNKRLNYNLLYFTLICLIASLVVYFAPGNSFRVSNFNSSLIHNPIISIKGTAFQTIQFLGYWFLDLALPIASILYLLILPKIKQSYWIKNSFFLTPIQGVFCILLIMVACIFPCYWNTGIIGQHRTMTVAYFMFLFVWFINLTIFSNYYSNYLIIQKIGNLKPYFFSLFIISILSMFIIKNGLQVNIDTFTKRAINFDTEMKNRYELIEKSKTQKPKTAYVPAIKNTDCTLFIWDIKPQHKHWMNKGYCQYFDIDELYLK